MNAHKLPIVVGSVLIAVLTWISVNMQYEYTAVRSVPVVFENFPPGKALKYPIPKMMTMRVQGNGWKIGGLLFSPGVKYYIDLASIGSEPHIIREDDVLEHVTLPVDLKVLDVKPETLMVGMGYYDEKRVPLVPRVVLDLRTGYGQVGPIRVEPESIAIGGAPEYLAKISEWNTEYRKYDRVRGPIEDEIYPEQLPSYSIMVEEVAVKLSVDVQPLAEKVIPGIRVDVTALPTTRDVIFIPPKFDLIVRGGIEQLSRLSSDRFGASVAFESLEEDSTGFIIPTLHAPNDVKVVGRNPERIQFIIRKKL